MHCRSMRARSALDCLKLVPRGVPQSTQAQFAFEGYSFRAKVDEQARMAITGGLSAAPNGAFRALCPSRSLPH